MAERGPFTHDLGDGLIVGCMSCPEHGTQGWDWIIRRSKEKAARVARMHREYRRRTRTRRARRG